ncbi:hypothetical protein TI39_contig387g00011, partial [Zymoseptoria brevis]
CLPRTSSSTAPIPITTPTTTTSPKAKPCRTPTSRPRDLSSPMRRVPHSIPQVAHDDNDIDTPDHITESGVHVLDPSGAHQPQSHPSYAEQQRQHEQEVQAAERKAKNVTEQVSREAKDFKDSADADAQRLAGSAKKDLNKGAQDAKNTANQVGKDAKDTANQVSKDAKSTANQVSKDAKNTANQLGKDAKDTANQVGKDVQNAANKVGSEAKNVANEVGREAKDAVDSAVSKDTKDAANQVGKDAKNLANKASKDVKEDAKNLADKAEKKFDEAKKEAKPYVDKAERKGKEAEEWAEKNKDNPVVVGNAVALTVLAGVLSIGAYRMHKANTLTWNVVGAWAGALGVFAVGDYYVSQYFFQRYPTKKNSEEDVGIAIQVDDPATDDMLRPEEKAHRTARILSSVAATMIALSCGTNYGFSAWAPQFAARLHLTATQTNLIGNSGNIGMYAMGIPGGIMIDAKGPRWGVFPSCICLAIGYFGLKSAYDNGPGSVSLPVLCFLMMLTGLGSCTAFSAAIKVSASNWPRHRGTATAFPLSAFGLSAFFYTTVAAIFFPDDTSGYLYLLSFGTTSMTFLGMIFLSIVTHAEDGLGGYGVVPTDDDLDQSSLKRDDDESTRLHRTTFNGHARGRSTQSRTANNLRPDSAEISYLVPSTSSSSTTGPGDIPPSLRSLSTRSHHSAKEITGTALLTTPRFWHLFILLSLLCGVGLMTINNIGNVARSLWTASFPSLSTPDFLQQRQLMHVSILSFCSFLGRLVSGIGSDALIHRGMSRYWNVMASACVFSLAQVVALTLTDPHHLFWLSGLTGVAYGILFGVYPALVADAFGAKGMGINWGAMTWAPVISGNLFNVAYGRILDAHSKMGGEDGGERTCSEGRGCYRDAYWVTLASSVVGVGWCLWCIRLERRATGRDARKGLEA